MAARPVNYAAGRFCILITISLEEAALPLEASLRQRSGPTSKVTPLLSLSLCRIHRLIALIPRDRRSFVSCGTIPRAGTQLEEISFSFSFARLSRADFSRAPCPLERERERDEAMKSSSRILPGWRRVGKSWVVTRDKWSWIGIYERDRYTLDRVAFNRSELSARGNNCLINSNRY